MLLENSSSSLILSTTRENSSARHSHGKRRHPKNALIVNFSEGEIVFEDDVRRELAQFGRVRSVIMCSWDGCQAFVTMGEDLERDCSACESVSRILETTNGFMFVNGSVWTVCRPKEWEKLIKETEKKTEKKKKKLEVASRNEVGAGEMVTVDQLTDIFNDFLRHNSSVSQSSLFSNSTSSFIGGLASSSSSSPRSCDSSVTITPLPIYPAQKSTGFILLPPPYHILPDTPFFRRAKIIPPPPSRSAPLSRAQNVMNLYIGSIQKDESSRDQQCRWWSLV